MKYNGYNLVKHIINTHIFFNIESANNYNTTAFLFTINYVLFNFLFLRTLRRRLLLLPTTSSIRVFKPESLKPENTPLQLLNQI